MPLTDDDGQETRSAPDLILGRFEVIAVLGRGGMGEVLHVRDVRTDAQFALKRIPEALSGTAAEVEDLRRTFQRVYRLHHPSIAACHFLECDPGNGRWYLLLELVEGVPLARILRRDGPLPEPRVVALLRQAADALDFAHREGLVHRDVKPSNLMVTPGDRLKLIDFGLAAQVKTTLAGPRGMEDASSMAGTRPYLAPEVWRVQPASPASDQWALACTAYECLAGRRPFPDEDPAELRLAILNDAPPRPEGISDSLWEGLSRALAKDPSGRWKSCAPVFDASLRPAPQVASAKPPIDSPTGKVPPRDPLATRLRAWGRTHRRWLAALGTAAGLVAAGLAGIAIRDELRLRADRGAYEQAVAAGTSVAMQAYLDTCGPCRWRPEATARKKKLAEEERLAAEKAAARQQRAAEEGVLDRLATVGIDRNHPAVVARTVFQKDGLLWVSSDKSGDERTIQAAVDRVAAGGLVVVLPGEHDGFDVTREVHITGAGRDPDRVQVIGRARPAVRYRAGVTQGSLQGLSLDVRAGEFPTLEIEGASPRIEGNTLKGSGAPLPGVAAATDLAAGRQKVLKGDPRAQPRKKPAPTSDPRALSLAVVRVQGAGANPEVRRNVIRDGGGAGILVRDKAKGTFQSNDLSGLSLAALVVADDADPLVRENVIHDGLAQGVVVDRGGRGTLERNIIRGNKGAGIEVRNGGNPMIRERNEIRDGAAEGVLFLGGGRGVLRGNVIAANQRAGVRIQGDGNATVDDNRIHDGRDHGIEVSGRNSSAITSNDVDASQSSGLEVCCDATPTVRGNRIRRGKGPGLVVGRNGGGEYRENVIEANAGDGIELRGPSVGATPSTPPAVPSFTRNQIRGNAKGVHTFDAARGTFEANVLSGNGGGDWDVSRESILVRR